MKNLRFIFLLLVTVFTFSSCFEEEVFSCVDVNKFSDDYFKLEAEVFSTKKVAFEISNTCAVDLRVIEVVIAGDSEDFWIEGIKPGTVISKKSTPFNLVFKPTKFGQRKAIISIRYDTGELAISINGEGV